MSSISTIHPPIVDHFNAIHWHHRLDTPLATILEQYSEHRKQLWLNSVCCARNNPKPAPPPPTSLELTGVVLGFGKGETSLKALIQIIDIALGDKEGRLSHNKVATIWRILEACYKEREDNRSNGRGNDGGGSGSGSGSSSDDDNPSGGALPLQVGSS